jgi:hypothetical protein
MLRIVRSIDAGTTILTVSGRVGSEQLPELRRSGEEKRSRALVLDLAEVGLVNVEAVGGEMWKATKARRALLGFLPIIALVLGYQEGLMSQFYL